ncbi:MAG: hypothetical protein PHT94_04360 [Candidatus Nanoarchaeia archaeon]|nr:hypothetical protein [Candidatus Nanoarchaeia archaeon]
MIKMEKLSKAWYGTFIEDIHNITKKLPEKNFFDMKKDIQRLSILISRNLISENDTFINKIPEFITQLDFFMSICENFSYISKEDNEKINLKIKEINEEYYSIKKKKKEEKLNHF